MRTPVVIHRAKWMGKDQIRKLLGESDDSVLNTSTVASSAGVVTLNLGENISRYELTLTENVDEWVFENLPASGTYKEVLIDIVQHASSAKTVVSPASTDRTAGANSWAADPVLSSRETLILQVFSDGVVALYPTLPQV